MTTTFKRPPPPRYAAPRPLAEVMRAILANVEAQEQAMRAGQALDALQEEQSRLYRERDRAKAAERG